MQFYCNKPNPRKAIQPVCRNGCYRTGGLPPRTLPFIPYDPNKPAVPLALISPCGLSPGVTGFENLESLCTDPNQATLTESVTGVRYSDAHQQLRLQRRQRGCCPLPEFAKYMRQPPGLGFVATPESAVRMQMIKMMREGHACDAGCTARGYELQNMINRAGCACPITVNISAAQMGCCTEKSPCAEGEKVVKIISLNWEDILKKSGMKTKVPVCQPIKRNRSVELIHPQSLQ